MKCTRHFGLPILPSSGIGVSLMRMHCKRLGLTLQTRWVLVRLTWPSTCWRLIWPSGLCHGNPRLSPLCPSDFLPRREVTIPRLLSRRGSCRILMMSLLWCLCSSSNRPRPPILPSSQQLAWPQQDWAHQAFAQAWCQFLFRNFALSFFARFWLC